MKNINKIALYIVSIHLSQVVNGRHEMVETIIIGSSSYTYKPLHELLFIMNIILGEASVIGFIKSIYIKKKIIYIQIGDFDFNNDTNYNSIHIV